MNGVEWKQMAGGVRVAVPAPTADECGRGHEFTPENTVSRGGRRECRTCKQKRDREAWANLSPEQRAAKIAQQVVAQRNRRRRAS